MRRTYTDILYYTTWLSEHFGEHKFVIGFVVDRFASKPKFNERLLFCWIRGSHSCDWKL
jgi:hypothetical protein